MAAERIYITLAWLAPSSYKASMKKLLIYADMPLDATVWTGFSMFYSLGIAALFILIMSLFLAWPFYAYLVLFPIFFAVVLAVFYFLVAYAGDQRAKEVENSLPDALQLIGANIRAGITPDKALFLSARPEFGVLSEEILKIGEETIAGKDIGEALSEMPGRINSITLRRVINLIVEGIASGGELASLLEKTADDIRMSDVLNKEMQANVGMYTVFVVLAAVIAAPVLYAVSVNFVEMSANIRQSVEISSIAPQMAVPGGVRITPFISQGEAIDIGTLRIFSAITLAVSSIFGALVMGVLKEGDEKEGVKYIPPFVCVALILFFVATFLISIVIKMAVAQ
jgi:hypothetical protein